VVKADRSMRKPIFVACKVSETWEEGEEFGDFIARLRKRYSKKMGTEQVLILVA